jgi:N-methylhydantoinase A
MGMSLLVAVDTGGTFTDFVAFDAVNRRVILRKALTRYDDLVEGMLTCAEDAGLSVAEFSSIKHGSTHVINAFLQRRGARAALITTSGFRDILQIKRCGRPRDFDLHFETDAPLVPRSLRFEVTARMNANGTEIAPLIPSELISIVERLKSAEVESVAISFVNSYVNDRHEKEAAEFLRSALPSVFVTTGTQLSREWFEYERTSTAAANAYVGPSTRKYVERFAARLEALGNKRPFYMMASHGGVLTTDEAVQAPISLVESGPIGGCIGAAAYAHALDLRKVVAFDMGGTTAKCALIEDGRFDIQSTYAVGGAERGFPIRTNVIDIVEVGAGGGSIASVDAFGRLSVGPRSAGAEPGPIVFRRGGQDPTVTDANVVLGRIGSNTFMGGQFSFDIEGASRAISEKVGKPLGYPASDVDRVAQGIITMACLTMGNAVREITIERGHDVREYDLFVFGGGGPLHAVDLARQLHIPRVIVPPEPGNFSAVGMLLADARVDESRTIVRLLAPNTLVEVSAIAREMIQACGAKIVGQFGLEVASQEVSLELRYKGQKHSLRIDFSPEGGEQDVRATFDQAYRGRYGHSDPEANLEIVGLHVSVRAPAERPALEHLTPSYVTPPLNAPLRRSVYFSQVEKRLSATVYSRNALPQGFSAYGPAIIEEYGSTTVVGPLDRFEIGQLGEIRIYCE